MKILHISSAKTWRGGEQQIAYLISELHAMEDQIESFVLAPSNSPLAEKMSGQGFPVFTYHKHLLKYPMIHRQIKRICKAEEIDLIHVHDAHAHSFAVMSAAIWNNTTRIVLSRRVNFGIRKNFFSKWKYNHSSIKRILCVSKQVIESIEGDIEDKSKLKLVYSGVDPGRFDNKGGQVLRQEFQIPVELPIIANTAAIAPDKDHMTFVKTAKLFFEKGGEAIFLIIGKDQGEKKKVESLIDEYRLSEKILFTGFRTDIDIVLPEIDIYFFSSKMEGLGTSLLDAFVAGIPIVATDAGGIPELIEHEVTGLLGPRENPEQLSELLLRMAGDEMLRQTVVEGAREKSYQFTKSKTAKETLNNYYEVLGK